MFIGHKSYHGGKRKSYVCKVKIQEKSIWMLGEWQWKIGDGYRAFHLGVVWWRVQAPWAHFILRCRGGVLGSRKRLRWEGASLWLLCNPIFPHSDCSSWKVGELTANKLGDICSTKWEYSWKHFVNYKGPSKHKLSLSFQRVPGIFNMFSWFALCLWD